MYTQWRNDVFNLSINKNYLKYGPISELQSSLLMDFFLPLDRARSAIFPGYVCVLN